MLITGAHGLIGNLLYARLDAQPARYMPYGSARRIDASLRAIKTYTPIPDERLRIADVHIWNETVAAVAGMHTVVHLAGNANSGGPWEDMLRDNIIGAHNIFEAARQAGVQRIIFASSNQVVFGYRDTEPYASLLKGRFESVDLTAYRPITVDMPTRPHNHYSVSKVLGESLCQLYSLAHGVSCIALRIGWVTPDDRVPVDVSPVARSLWCSQRDILQLLTRAIDAPMALRHGVFFGHSRNRYNLVDIQHTIDGLGWDPQDGAE